MKNLRYIWAVLTFCCASSVVYPSATTRPDSVRLVWQDSTALTVSFPLSTGDVRVRSDYRLIVTPRLCGADGQSLSLNAVEFAGKRNQKYVRRQNALAGKTDIPQPHSLGDTVWLETRVPVEKWMLHTPVQLVLDREMEGCCRVEDLPPLTLASTEYIRPFVPQPVLIPSQVSVADEIARREPILRPIDDCMPYDPSVPLRKMETALYVHFRINRWELREDFRENRQTLDKIVDMMHRIQADSTSRIVKVVIIGLASPEGPKAFNERLAGNRAKALKDYVAKRIDMPEDVYEVINGGEAWADLRDVVAESSLEDLPERDELLRIIDETPDVNERERLIRRLNGGRAFRYLKQSVFADQRNSGYISVCYENVPDVGARTINQAVEQVNAGHYAEAVRLLEPLKDVRKLNVLGVAYYYQNRMDQALQCFDEAARAGNAEARKNAEELRTYLQKTN